VTRGRSADSRGAGADRSTSELPGDGATRPGTAHEIATDRAESFSDGVFAVAVTLLVLDLDVHHDSLSMGSERTRAS
jgi:hypothetical protein